MTGPRCHKLTSQSDALCGQLQPLRQATSHVKMYNVLQLRKDFMKTWRNRQKYFAGRLHAILRMGFSISCDENYKKIYKEDENTYLSLKLDEL